MSHWRCKDPTLPLEVQRSNIAMEVQRSNVAISDLIFVRDTRETKYVVFAPKIKISKALLITTAPKTEVQVSKIRGYKQNP